MRESLGSVHGKSGPGRLEWEGGSQLTVGARRTPAKRARCGLFRRALPEAFLAAVAVVAVAGRAEFRERGQAEADPRREVAGGLVVPVVVVVFGVVVVVVVVVLVGDVALGVEGDAFLSGFRGELRGDDGEVAGVHFFLAGVAPEEPPLLELLRARYTPDPRV
eukprot:CAMPEP_0174903464 /NCGR_PEP_ID=MMETSP0167-20121228/43918_1 /TAXON_ID=38298 /ORGANISM="Rhodella maculata, Strain CCMP736" /LENGTH=162 /DNA_ID=CAMNT_0016145799 /DNA_START=177 /DNA_END=662 /DNA_ORIENTATION=+